MQSPLRTDVLVIGAGPAGSAAARVLAQQGFSVVFADRHAFPRDKVCGDALIPDAQHALRELGLQDQVDGLSHRSREIRFYAPNNSVVAVDGGCMCVPRVVFDDVLRTAAVDAGAEFKGRWRALRPIERDGRVGGAEFVDLETGATVEVRAKLTMLATGGASEALQRFAACLRTTASATAARMYIEVDAAKAERHGHLAISYIGSICPGYGWVFPGPRNVFNIGVGYFYDAPRLPAERNLHRLLETFCRNFKPAAELVAGGRIVSRVQGAPLRTAMSGAHFGRPGLMVLGEAAGLTYSFSGEGIGKALQSGILAARLAAEFSLDTEPSGTRLINEYTTQLRERFGRRFKAYAHIQRGLANRRLANFLTRRANKGRYVRAELEALFNETGDPDKLFSMRSLIRALLT
jgi:geranylgeranyl reductase family protein